MKRFHVGWMTAVLLAGLAVGNEVVGQEAGESAPAEAQGEEMMPSERRQAIDWRAASMYRQIPSERAPERLREALAESPVPVLLPDSEEVLRTVEPTVTENWYAAMLEVEGREVTIEGDRVARVASDLEVPPAGEEQAERKFKVTQTHGVMTVTFTSFGAGYTIDIECEKVNERGHCTDESFAIDVANSLAVLGGDR